MLVMVGDNGVPESAFPLKECEGDCDFDEDCELDLVCELRDDREDVPYCVGKGSQGVDYCRSLPKPTASPSTSPVTSKPTSSPSLSPVTSKPTNLQPTGSNPTVPPSLSPVTLKPSSSPTAVTKCILITTGTGEFDNGYLNVLVNDGSGYVEVTTPDIIYEKGQVVLDECYVNLIGIQVTNTETNAWIGSIEYSINDQLSYSAMICDDCIGIVETAEDIVVDGNSDGFKDTGVACLNGNVCTLYAPGATPTSAPETFTPGELTVSCDNGKLRLSTVSHIAILSISL